MALRNTRTAILRLTLTLSVASGLGCESVNEQATAGRSGNSLADGDSGSRGELALSTPQVLAEQESPGDAFRPVAIIAADFDNDGYDDLVAAHLGQLFSSGVSSPDLAHSDLSIFLGNGNGGFLPERRFGGTVGQFALTAADLNGDNILDVALANSGSAEENEGGISIFQGNGDGTFAPVLRVARSSSVQSLAVSDFNNDGFPDLVFADIANQTLYVLMGSENGVFQEGAQFAIAEGLVPVTTGDFNGDRSPDIVIAEPSQSRISVALGRGDGTFAPVQVIPTDSPVIVITSGNLDEDNKDDLVALMPETNRALILSRYGSGSFAIREQYSTGTKPVDVNLADIDGDGIVDLIVANAGSPFEEIEGAVSVLHGNGDATFVAPRSFAIGAIPLALASADIDNDADIDVVVANLVSMVVLKNERSN